MWATAAPQSETGQSVPGQISGRRERPSHEFNRLTVRDVRRETLDSVSIAFDVPDDLAARYRFVPGQYLTLRHAIGGEEVRRCYSISSGLDDGELRVVVKRVADGTFSSFVHSEIRPGMEMDVMTPGGTFIAPIGEANSRTYLGIAAGSGITPIMSILRSVLAREPDSRFILLYGNRNTNSIIFREALDDLKDLYLERLSVFHTLSREATDVPLYSGRLDAEKLKAFARFLFDPATIDQAFLCGPGSMIAALRTTLTELGMEPNRIREELFTPADGAVVKTAPRAAAAAVDGAEITAILDGTARRFVMGAGDENVIDAARANGIELPYSCKGGMCSTCRAKVVEGEVDMTVNYSLEPWEVEAGFVLTCQSRPTTQSVTIDYDQV